MNRWRVVVGGVSMNLALGSLYAWSVFVLPLEKEFGWTRSQTSWVYTIAVVVFATHVHARRPHAGSEGPRPCAFARRAPGLARVLRSRASRPRSGFSTSLRPHRRRRQRIRLCDADAGRVEMVSGQTRARRRTDGRRLRRGLGDFRTDRHEPRSLGRLATDVPAFSASRFCVMDDGRRRGCSKNPPAGYRPPNWTPPAGARCSARDFTTREMLRTPQFYCAVDRVLRSARPPDR